ncbi:MAG: hemerythrin domain-containing protein [Dehalococcoidia bacterium]|nr:hemerythrin domain-containing protein [Dehalococcoidia bacterium]
MTTVFDPISEFREDHRKVRDGLLVLAAAAEAGDMETARKTLGAIDTLVGPHFRYEEEALYPALREFLGEYVDQLVAEHNGVVATAKVAAELLSKPTLTKEEGHAVAKAARSLLVHVSNCDGLNILAERFSHEKLAALGRKYQKARKAGVGLLKWADTIRAK